MTTRRGFLAWLCATPLLAFLRPVAKAAPPAPKFTGGFGPLNPPKAGERSFWEPDRYVLGVDMAHGEDVTVYRDSDGAVDFISWNDRYDPPTA